MNFYDFKVSPDTKFSCEADIIGAFSYRPSGEKDEILKLLAVATNWYIQTETSPGEEHEWQEKFLAYFNEARKFKGYRNDEDMIVREE